MPILSAFDRDQLLARLNSGKMAGPWNSAAPPGFHWTDAGDLRSDVAGYQRRQNYDPLLAQLRVSERGVGLTLACGTGACAAAVAAVRRGLTERAVTLTLDGGDLAIEWREADGHVIMTGPTALSFKGELGDGLSREADG